MIVPVYEQFNGRIEGCKQLKIQHKKDTATSATTINQLQVGAFFCKSSNWSSQELHGAQSLQSLENHRYHARWGWTNLKIVLSFLVKKRWHFRREFYPNSIEKCTFLGTYVNSGVFPPQKKGMNGNIMPCFWPCFDPPPASKAAGVVSPNTERTTPKANLQSWQ